ncbi:signal peptide peptidase SppA [Roseateles sp. BYS180W]|uniref:Signal peptide peptidase SppA n=1 Tax=Roseateles rivi TaxID=3299028 RepID=A0ABW7FTB8_9BURK
MLLKKLFAPLWWLLKKTWWLLDGTRRAILNLLLLLVIVALVWGMARSGPKPLQERSTLVLDIKGSVVEQYTGSGRDQALAQLQGQERSQTQLRDVLQVLKAAGKDPHVAQLLLDLDGMSGASPAALREISSALAAFKKAGNKRVIAYAEQYDQRAYFLAAQADEVYLHPMGMVALEGFGRYRTYYRDALDRVGIAPHVIKVGSYKNFAETYSANAPSKPSLEAEAYLWDDLWARYTREVEQARKLPSGALMAYINELPQRLNAVGGSPAQLALKEKLVDGLKTADELKELLLKRGALDDKRLRQVGLMAYQAQLPKAPAFGDAVGVIVAEGEIVDGQAAPGRVGGESTAALVRQAREDEHIKAIVLRVNSPGGSAFASELVRRELELARKAGKPVVVSMGGVAASGGYWISMAADEVLAEASTITGSIGVVAMLPTAEKLMDKLSVRTGGYTTTWLAGGFDPRRPLDPRLESVVQSAIQNIYTEFTGKAAQARKKTPAQIDAVGQGRVWSGAQALERGLVDRLGLLDDAIAAAAKRAKLSGEPVVRYVEGEPDKFQRLLHSLGDTLAPVVKSAMTEAGVPQVPAALQPMQRELSWLAEQAQSAQLSAGRVPALAHCLCTLP